MLWFCVFFFLMIMTPARSTAIVRPPRVKIARATSLDQIVAAVNLRFEAMQTRPPSPTYIKLHLAPKILNEKREKTWNYLAVCVSSGELIGTIDLVPPGFFGTSYYIKNFAVHEKYRRNGIGKMLLSTAVLDAIEINARNAKAIELSVDRTNDGAILFYKKMGFEFVKSGNILEMWNSGENNLKVARMRLALN